uniref:Tetratricopeptide repeat domain 6 n=2 Tax=Pipistrellus kuhlii TaxID=59472 RepID=A0A7J8B617_PIPKU|nr:tetratricopeptide repeat domain 6 [Pipistrellus kuhlii]
MSRIPKHFGLSYKEESHMFRELEKVRRKTKQDFQRFKQRLASKTLVDGVPVVCGPARPGAKGGFPRARPREPPGLLRWAKDPAAPAAGLLQRALRDAGPWGPGEGAAPWRPPFRPRDFYLRSSAFRRHRASKEPPIITTGAGTSRPVVLRPPPAWRRKPAERAGRWSPQPAEAQPELRSSPARARSPFPAPARARARVHSSKVPAAPPGEAWATRETKGRATSRTSSAGGEAGGRRRRVRIRSQVLRDSAPATPWDTPRAASKASADSLAASERLSASAQSPLPVRLLPTSIEEILASQQSEAHLASDQTIKELIQSVLGQNYDINMEDTSLMGKMYWHRPSQVQTEQELPITIEEPQLNEADEIPETVSSVFPSEQEDILEWGPSDAESGVFKPQESSEVQQAGDSNKPLEDKQFIGGSEKAKQLSIKVKSSELLQIRGKEVKLTKTQPEFLRQRKCGKSKQDQKRFKAKIPQDLAIPTLHDLCTTVPDRVLPVDLHLASRVYHTASKRGHDTILEVFGNSFFDDHFTAKEQKYRLWQGIPLMSDNQAYVSDLPTMPVIPPELPQETRWHDQKPRLQLFGEEMCAYPGITKFFWKSTSQKFSVPVSVMKKTVYPNYESVQGSRILIEKFLSESRESVVVLSQQTQTMRIFSLRKSASYENIPKSCSTRFSQLKRIHSAIELSKEKTVTPLKVKNDMESSLKEVLFQKAKELERRQEVEQTETEEITQGKENLDNILDTMEDSHSLRTVSLSLIEASRKAGISYIVYPRKRKTKSKKFSKLSTVLADLSKPPKVLSRSTSHGILPEQKKYLIKLPLYERQFRSPSLPTYLNFEKFVQRKGGIPENSDVRTWVLDIFSKEIYQKTKEEKVVKIIVQKDFPVKEKEPLELELNDSLKCDLPLEVIKHYESEVKILTEDINSKKTYPAFSYCRRGALYRKLGKLQSAMDDLQEAIFLEPLLLNAYWHRHLIYLFQDKFNEALDDLNYITKCNKNNAEAYLSKAEIFRKRKEVTLAILNYTQAIKLKPMDADIYFRRGEMYELTNKFLAIDDFSTCIFYDPKRTVALLKRGMFHYENENWNSAIQDFTALLNVDPQNSQARTYRGKSYFKRQFYKQATQDFSAAIHLDPNNWLAYYYRGCIFRKGNPFRALQDYSVSALINDGYENLGCFLHRGILYAHLKLWLLAICDFETVISLERTVTLAYINIGIIDLLHLDNYIDATWHFSEAIKIDPSYIQSYMCLAETYSKVHKLQKAVREITRAIHLQPDRIELYIIRGQYLLRMKCYDLAKFTIYQVAEMNKGLIELSPIQQALIYSFCENHEAAIQVLDGATLNKPEINMIILLAKTQMKAKRNKEAMRLFKKVLDLCCHPNEKGSNALEASVDCLYNLGLCYMDEGNFQTAFDYFSKAVKINPSFAEGFHQRGLCKIKLQRDSSILDFNRAITFNPQHYEAYLNRVAFYGLKGRYSKAILNCNEAIKIYPQSVRAYIYRGVLKYHNRTCKLAITDLTTAINMDKNSYVAFYNRALCYTKIGELQMALIDYGIVLLLDPAKTVAFNTLVNRGLIYLGQGHHHFALEDFKQAAFLSKTNVSLYQATAMCCHRNKEFEEAVLFFTRAISINPCFVDAYTGRGNSYMEYGHSEGYKQAQKEFLKALHYNPICLKARISLGYNLQAQEKFQKAWNHFTIGIEIDPKCHLAYEGRAVVCLQMGDNFAAIQDINTAIKINATAEFLTNRGVIHEFMGQKQNAMKDYQAAISLNPTYALAYFNAGNIYFHHRQFSQASDYFSKALQFDPENECAAMNRAIANTILKKYEEAKEDFANIVENCPFWAAAYFNRAQFYCCLKQYELAEEDLSKALSLNPNDALIYNLRAEVRGKIGVIEEAMADYNQALDLQEYAK